MKAVFVLAIAAQGYLLCRAAKYPVTDSVRFAVCTGRYAWRRLNAPPVKPRQDDEWTVTLTGGGVL
jgi:hypothetical protein